MQYWANENWTNRQPDARDLLELRRRTIIKPNEYTVMMKREGFDKATSDKIFTASQIILGFGEVLTLYRRQVIKETDFYAASKKLGIDKKTADQLFKSAEYFPSPTDIVRFAVREVYTPDIVEKFGLDEDLPDVFMSEAAKAGLPQKQATNFWRAHWILPSIQLGYEMLHRDVIKEDELDLLMRTQDIMPFWRDKLKQISYVPYTRVDVRRMYGTGVLDRDDVFRSYKDIGYDDAKAEKMTEFTIAFAEPAERSLTRTMILEGYEQGEITRKECVTYLGAIGYDAPNADYIVGLSETKWKQEDMKTHTETLAILFKDNRMSQEQYIAELDKLDLKSSYRNKLVAKALTEKKVNLKLPTKADVKDWLKLELITVSAFATYYQRLGYTKTEITLYLEEIFLSRLEETEKKAREANPKLIPRAKLTSLFIEETIDEKRLRKGFSDLFFRPKDIEILVTSAELKHKSKKLVKGVA